MLKIYYIILYIFIIIYIYYYIIYYIINYLYILYNIGIERSEDTNECVSTSI